MCDPKSPNGCHSRNASGRGRSQAPRPPERQSERSTWNARHQREPPPSSPVTAWSPLKRKHMAWWIAITAVDLGEFRPIPFPEIRRWTEALQAFCQHVRITKAFDQLAAAPQGRRGRIIEHPRLDQKIGRARRRGGSRILVERPSAQRDMPTLPKILLVQRHAPSAPRHR